MKPFFILILLLLTFQGKSQSTMDSTVIGRIIDCDSIEIKESFSRIGLSSYFGLQHYKIAVIDPVKKIIVDTVIIAYVYNILLDRESYLKNFGFKIGQNYIFQLSRLSPSKACFPGLQGYFDANNGCFYPSNNRLIKKYDSILWIIYFVSYLD